MIKEEIELNRLVREILEDLRALADRSLEAGDLSAQAEALGYMTDICVSLIQNDKNKKVIIKYD